MSGPTISKANLQEVELTPEEATRLLELNTLNRPLNETHVKRIANQIATGKWKFNGDTIKISEDNQVLDGQHRLWACVEAKTTIRTILVRGVERDAFATIDTLRKPRSGADVLALSGASRHRQYTSAALQWLIRWQRGILEQYRAPQNRVENSDVEVSYQDNPGIERAVERVMPLRGLVSPASIGFFYYVLANRSPELAERMVFTLENPAGISMNDPFFRLRMYLSGERSKRRDSIMTFALMFKAANAAFHNRELKTLAWRNQGQAPEPFPKLEVVSNITLT